MEKARKRIWARLDAERPWWVLTYYDVGLVIGVRGKTIGDALTRIRVFPPGRMRYHSEPFGDHGEAA